MKKSEAKQLLKIITRYKEYCLSGQDPFGYQNAIWASGFDYFLSWLLSSQIRKDR